MKQTKVSVIIPVWNPGSGIRRCVDSLRCQTLEDIEMIFVDDCGTDGSMDVIREAAANDSRIRIVTNAENMGAGASRNAAIEVAHGEYLSFVDADDYVSPNFLDSLYTKAKSEDLDIVKGGFERESEDGTTMCGIVSLNERIRAGLSNGEPLFYLFDSEFQSALYHRRLFAYSNVRFGRTSHGEDTYFLLKVCHTARSFAIDNSTMYWLAFCDSSATGTVTKESLDNRVAALRDKAEYLLNHVTPSTFAARYLSRSLKYYLALQRFVEQKAGKEKEASGFLSDLRAVALDYTGIWTKKNDDFSILALVDHGVSLPEYHFMSQWRTKPDDYIDFISWRIEFLIAHPEYYRQLPKLADKAAWFARRMQKEGVSPNEIEAYRQKIRVLWRKPAILWMRLKLKVEK